MDKERAAAIAAIAARGDGIRSNSAEYLWVCRGIKPPPLPDKPVTVDPNVNSHGMENSLRLTRSARTSSEQ
jgi:hypothetical protein